MKLLITLVAMALAGISFAQDFRSTLQGTVYDPTQASVSGAAIVLKNIETAQERSATSNSDGFYIFQLIPPGNYEMSVKAAGFRTYVEKGLSLALTQTLRQDVRLQLGDTSETVNVSASVAVLETDSTALGTAIRAEVRDNLPLKGRSSLFMFTLTPGVVNNRYGEDTRPNDTITNIFFSANGAPVAATDVFVDGSSNTVNVNRGVNISQWVPSVDSIAEFKLEMGTLSAEYGRSGGSITNMVIKSGTNSLHGSAYEFFRNSALDANLYFARGQGRPLAAFGANTFGFTLGGPVWIPKLYNGRNRTFWFTSYEGAREGNGQDNILSVPTAKMRTGDFSEVAPSYLRSIFCRHGEWSTYPNAVCREPCASGETGCGLTKSDDLLAIAKSLRAQRRPTMGAKLRILRQVATQLRYDCRQVRPQVFRCLDNVLPL